MGFGQRSSRQPHRGGATANEQRLARPNLQSSVQRAPGSLDHFGQRAQMGPVQRRLDALDLVCGHAHKVAIRPVELAPHAAHRGGNRLADLKFQPRRGGDFAHRLDPQNSREGDAGRMALAGEQFRAVEAKCFDADQHPAWLWFGDRALDQLQNLRRAGPLYHHRAHRLFHPAPLFAHR